ncbi:MAG: hypothetical protein CL840_15920 [Crocinitomicaceae bacterium]|nr:hypothetical protein [Crocinitomicaceae bacterium]|tara:strand:+ start:649 stop:924 length:276 start_codon:yes stop_codon:yes gene_type:complete
MNKSELIERIAEDTGLSKKDADAAVKSFQENVMKGLADGESLTLVGFGTFSTKVRPEREGRNPQTGASMTIKAATIPQFKPGKTFKERVDA